MSRLASSFLLALSAAMLVHGGESWSKKDYATWTPAEAQQLLSGSAWAKLSQGFIGTTDEDPHTYLAKGPSARDIGLGGPESDEWFPVGKLPPTHMPTLPVTIRWDSALPVREALVRLHAPGVRDTDGSLKEPEKYYIIGIAGLAIPRKPASMEQPDHSWETSLRQALVNRSRLFPKNGHPIVPENARIDPTTGNIQIFFPKTTPLSLSDKEVLFGTVFGSVRVSQKFRLKDMVYRGKLDL